MNKQILESRGDGVGSARECRVHYKNWSSSCDEWVPDSCLRRTQKKPSTKDMVSQPESSKQGACLLACEDEDICVGVGDGGGGGGGRAKE